MKKSLTISRIEAKAIIKVLSLLLETTKWADWQEEIQDILDLLKEKLK